VLNGQLGAGEIHSWSFSALVDDKLTISVAPNTNLDMEISIYGPDESKLAGRNDQSAGGTETVEIEIAEDGDISIQVKAASSGSGPYALVVTDEYSDPVVFLVGNLSYGGSASRFRAAGTEHIWHFLGEAGDVVDIELTTPDDIDLKFRFFGPAMGDPIALVDGAGSGAAEQASFTLAETGFYTIWISELSGKEGSYGLSLMDD